MPKKPGRRKPPMRISDEGRERRGDNREDTEAQEKAEPKKRPITLPKLKRFMRSTEGETE